ncbi:antitoxin [Brevundimonas sp.]|uniref:antitoxin n=1 Tax=Brevundimonas sp. TaxID=1871086 RepID=UPI001A360C49|nr:antitoxin [Brevundimonas sp.]MBJ7483723.1 antitoxin [Brevundimonas sp.]
MAEPAAHPLSEHPFETPSDREARLSWERKRIAEGDADFAAGRVIGGEEALDWLDRWAAGEELEDPAIA